MVLYRIRLNINPNESKLILTKLDVNVTSKSYTWEIENDWQKSKRLSKDKLNVIQTTTYNFTSIYYYMYCLPENVDFMSFKFMYYDK